MIFYFFSFSEEYSLLDFTLPKNINQFELNDKSSTIQFHYKEDHTRVKVKFMKTSEEYF